MPSLSKVNDEAATQLVALLMTQGYLAARVLPDGSVAALLRLVYTRAICLGCTPNGFSRRFCFSDTDVADAQFAALQSEDDEPVGFIAQR